MVVYIVTPSYLFLLKKDAFKSESGGLAGLKQDLNI